jgi:hypothetical protein
MANHAVLIVNKVEAKNVDARLRPAISASPIDNGNIFVLNQKTGVTGEGEVWLCTAPSSASQTRLWMSCEPEISFATAGDNIYSGLGNIQVFLYFSMQSVYGIPIGTECRYYYIDRRSFRFSFTSSLCCSGSCRQL